MNTRAANRYAKALLELVSQDKSEDQVNQDMQDIVETLAQSNELRNLLQSPIIQTDVKNNVLSSVFGKNVQPMTLKLFSLMAQNNRLHILNVVAQQFTQLYNTQKGNVKATVVTAVALDNDTKNKIIQKAKSIAGNQNIIIESKIDPNIIGGYILRIGDKQLDASIATQLQNVKRSLLA